MLSQYKYVPRPLRTLAALITLALALLSQEGQSEATPNPQTPADTTKLPEFEVASVRPTPPTNQIINALLTYPGGQIICKGCTLHYLITEAFHLQRFQISGGPHWIEEDRFEIEAKPAASSASSKSDPPLSKLPPNDEQRQMLQALLIDRFQLKFHQDTKEGRTYILTAHEKDLKLHSPKDKNEYPWAGGIGGGLPSGDGLRGTNITMPQLAERITSWLGHPVEDQTHLQGPFDFEYKTGEDDSQTTQDLASSVITSLKGIGLNLKASQGPLPSLAIYSVQKPSEN